MTMRFLRQSQARVQIRGIGVIKEDKEGNKTKMNISQ